MGQSEFDSFQDMHGTVRSSSKDGKTRSFFIPEKEQDTPRALKILSYCEMHFVVSPKSQGYPKSEGMQF